MPLIASVSENNSAPITSSTGTIATGALAGIAVTGVALAGQTGTGVGVAINGIYGSLTVLANGSYTYSLNNLDSDTNHLAAGDQATDRFVATYVLSGVPHTIDLNFQINGIDEVGQTTQIMTELMSLPGSYTIPADSYYASTAINGLALASGRNDFYLSYSYELVVNGSFEVRRTASPTGINSGVAVQTGYLNSFFNNGRIAYEVAGVNPDYVPMITAVAESGTNNGVISARLTLTASPNSANSQAVAWEGPGTNNGLVEAISTGQACAMWARGLVVNSGTIYAEGGFCNAPIGGIYAIRDAGGLINTGTIRAISTDPRQHTIGYSTFPGSTNIYANVMQIDNRGTIVADIAFYIAGGYNVATSLSNSGHIEGDLVIDSGVNVIENLATGSWIGNLGLGPQHDIIVNSGSITGRIDLGDGADYFANRDAGTVSGRVSGGNGQDILLGGAAADILSGGADADWLQGGAGADDLNGGGGADVFAYRSADDSIASARDTIADFQTGVDRIDLSGLQVSSVTLTASGGGTIVQAQTASGTLSILVNGTVALADIATNALSATLIGTGGNDLLVAAIAGSTIDGGAGDDTLVGTAGNDVLTGGPGTDTMFGGAGNDLYYADGQDRISEESNGGIDEIRTENGGTLQANIENATLLGTLSAGILGNGLDNVIIGNSAANYLNGGGGNDTVIGGGGGDYIQTTGRIVYVSAADSTVAAPDMINNFEHEITKIDLTALSVQSVTFDCHYSEYFFLYGVHLDYPVYITSWANVTVETPDGSLFFRVSMNADLNDMLITRSADFVMPLLGSTGDDVLGGTSGEETLQGLTGNDVLQGRGGNDLVDGGAGTDTATYADASSGVWVDLNQHGAQDTRGAGIDTLVSVENLTGSDFDDTLIGDDGSNRIFGAGGADRLYGGGGDDTYLVDGNADLIFENAGGGRDLVQTTGSMYLYEGIEGLVLLSSNVGGYADPDSYAVGNAEDNWIIGNAGNNLLLGGSGKDAIEGAAGNDIIYGEIGDDAIRGGFGIDYIVGGDGDDRLEGNYGADAVYGGAGSDLLYADSDPIQGDNIGSGVSSFYQPDFVTDILVGGDGNDQLFADSGWHDYDLLDGGSGDDTYWVDTGDDLTFEAVGGGIDTVHANIGLSNAGVYLYANVENLVLEGVTGFGVGNGLDNQLTGSASANWLLGGAGNDTIDGRGGNDVLFGESGADTFVFHYGEGADTIGDFHHGEDTISLIGIYANFAAMQGHFVQVGNDGAIDLGGGNFIVLQGVTMSTLTATDFLFA
ncbi:MAG: M10 family metallopeptidase C-terminal domain-containing protein [Novosphingobium sp.]